MEASLPGSSTGSFGLVITNPPYVSYGSRDQPQLAASASQFLRKCYPDTTEYKIRLHSVFQEIALRYGCAGGSVVLFIPDAFLTGLYYKKLRQRLLQDVQIVSLTELAENAIGSATVGRWCIASYRIEKPGPPASYDVQLFSFVESHNCTPAEPTHKKLQTDSSSPSHNYKLPLQALVSPDHYRFRLVFTDSDRDIWLHVDKLPNLRSVLAGHTGIRALHGQKSIISETKHGPTWRKAIISGSSVTRHVTRWDTYWLNINPSLLFAGGFNPAVIERPKLMVRQTADRIIAGRDDEALYHLNNVHSLALVGSDQTANFTDLDYYDGLINSTFWLYLYQSKSREAGRALAQIDIEMMESIPIPTDNDERRLILSRLTAGARCLSILPNQAGTHGLLPAVERAIDRLVYDLYDLSESQICHIENTCAHKAVAPGSLPGRQVIGDTLQALEAFTGSPGAAVVGGGL